MTLRHTLLGACLALPLIAYAGTAALAARPDGSRTITVPPGAVVLVLPALEATSGPATAVRDVVPANDPLLRLVAEQNAMMNDMMAQMNAAFAQPMFPASMDRMIQAAMHGVPPAGQDAGVVFTSVSDGPGVCTQRVTYAYPANGGKPQVTMTSSGNACGAFGQGGPLSVAQPVLPQAPQPAPQTPAAAPSHGPRLWTISDPPRPIDTTASPRS
jgi:hypothetical protein